MECLNNSLEVCILYTVFNISPFSKSMNLNCLSSELKRKLQLLSRQETLPLSDKEAATIHYIQGNINYTQGNIHYIQGNNPLYTRQQSIIYKATIHLISDKATMHYIQDNNPLYTRQHPLSDYP